MASMSMMTAAAPQAAAPQAAQRSGATGQAAGGEDPLFEQIMQQLQALVDKTQGQADGPLLPQDGEALPPELLDDLVEFAEQLQGELTPADQADGPAAALLELMRTIGAVDQTEQSVDAGSGEALLQLAEKLRNRSGVAKEALAANEAGAEESRVGIDPAVGRVSLEQARIAAATVSAQARKAVAAVEPSGAGSRSSATQEAQPASRILTGAGAESAAGLDPRGEAGSHQEVREQGLARWQELRDSVFAQGQKLAQSEAAVKGMLNSQRVAERGESTALSAANPSASLAQLQQAYQATSAAPSVAAAQPGFGQRFGSQAWTPAASERISMMAGQNISTAELRLDPPELGSLRVRLTLQGDQTSLSFVSPHAHVREVLEQQMPRLREMLAEGGLQLGQTDVSDQSGSRSANDESQADTGIAGAESDSNGQQSESLSLVQNSVALVDYYA
ncbi:MAG: flagellar hook-length control protein FliK [Motiliproteus sp.]|jgi:flagellar hook-length control protein FliK